MEKLIEQKLHEVYNSFMIRFNSDYIEGAHPSILETLTKTNMEQTSGYGDDPYTIEAKALVKKACGGGNIDVHFLVGGTQTNTTVIASILRPHQGALCAKSGHINVHESGAIEATGHKVLALDCDSKGKLTAQSIENAYRAHFDDQNFEHMVQPGMVYISNPTENGALYSKKELTEISEVCHKNKLYLYLDGARLGYALASPKNDLSLIDHAKLCDVFYIGGTKVGAMFGEAVVISNDNLKKDFRYFIKQHGGLFAKGRLLGIQFKCLFENNLYMEISANAINQAIKITNALKAKGVNFFAEPESNQLFPIVRNTDYKKLSEKYAFEIWCPVDKEKSAIRICTSWATTDSNTESLCNDISKLEQY